MPATGLDESRLKKQIVKRLQDEVGASEKDKEGNETLLTRVATILSEELIKEIKQAKVTVNIPASQVITVVSGGAGAPAVGVPNPSPIPADNSISGGLT